MSFLLSLEFVYEISQKTEWHPAFCAAMRLELKDNPTLEFHDEYNLNVDPLRMDLLIIHKPSDVKIDNQIGEFFGENNILEYKSPTDHGFNEYGLYQAMSYVYYYYDRYGTTDVTLSMVVSKNHFNLQDKNMANILSREHKV